MSTTGHRQVSWPGQPPDDGRLPATRKFYPEVEGLRGLLSLIVLFGHVGGALSAPGHHPFPWYWGSMEMFFCISGFLIGGNFFERYGGRISQAYFANRALRIWPMYYVSWAICVGVTAYFGDALMYGGIKQLGVGSGPGRLMPLIFLQNAEEHFGVAFSYVELFRHSWSVALEEQFYLLVPVVLVLLRRRSTAFVVAILALAVATSVLARASGLSPYAFLARMHAFALGLVLAICQNRVPTGDRVATILCQRSVLRAVTVVGCVQLIPYVAGTYGVTVKAPGIWRVVQIAAFDPYFAFAMIAFGVVGTIAAGHASSSPFRLLRSRMLQTLGRISYSTYLLHIPIVLVVVPWALRTIGLAESWLIPLAPVATLSLAYLTYSIVERPFIRRKLRPAPLTEEGSIAASVDRLNRPLTKT